MPAHRVSEAGTRTKNGLAASKPIHHRPHPQPCAMHTVALISADTPNGPTTCMFWGATMPSERWEALTAPRVPLTFAGCGSWPRSSRQALEMRTFACAPTRPMRNRMNRSVNDWTRAPTGPFYQVNCWRTDRMAQVASTPTTSLLYAFLAPHSGSAGRALLPHLADGSIDAGRWHRKQRLTLPRPLEEDHAGSAKSTATQRLQPPP